MTSIQQIAADVATFAPSSGYLKIIQNLGDRPRRQAK